MLCSSGSTTWPPPNTSEPARISVARNASVAPCGIAVSATSATNSAPAAIENARGTRIGSGSWRSSGACSSMAPASAPSAIETHWKPGYGRSASVTAIVAIAIALVGRSVQSEPASPTTASATTAAAAANSPSSNPPNQGGGVWRSAPSAIAMTLVAAALGGAERHTPPPWFGGLLDGLFAAAAAVVALAVVGLAGSLCTDLPTKAIAIATMAVTLALRPYPGFQWVSIALGALAGAMLLHAPELRHDPLPIRVPRAFSIAAGALFVALVALTAIPHGATLAFLATLIRAGSLVFGGGHVVLPLLQSMIHDGLIGAQDFFAGYGAVQAMPGPLNTFSSFLGYANRSPLHGIPGALVATVLIFLPSFALIFAIAPVWNRIAGAPRAAGAVRGANASVVGLLGAVLYDPVLVSLGTGWARIAIAIAALISIAALRAPPWIVVLAAAGLGALLGA